MHEHWISLNFSREYETVLLYQVCFFALFISTKRFTSQQIHIKTITRQCILVCTLFEIFMWIVILTLIAQWPEFQNSCCMIVFVVRIILDLSNFFNFPSRYHFWRVFFERFSKIWVYPNIVAVKYPLCVIKLILLNCTVRITLVLLTWKWMGVFLAKGLSWLLTATIVHSYIVIY